MVILELKSTITKMKKITRWVQQQISELSLEINQRKVKNRKKKRVKKNKQSSVGQYRVYQKMGNESPIKGQKDYLNK